MPDLKYRFVTFNFDGTLADALGWTGMDCNPGVELQRNFCKTFPVPFSTKPEFIGCRVP